MRDKAKFSGKMFIAPKTEKMDQKQGLNLLKNLVFNFFWIGSVMKTYMLCSISNCIFVPEIWAKMFSANQIARFSNQPYIQNKLMI